MSDREELYARRAHNTSINDEELDKLRSSLTSYESNGGATTHRNTIFIACPAYEKPFNGLAVCEDDYNSLELSMILDLCVTQYDGDVLLFTHKQEE